MGGDDLKSGSAACPVVSGSAGGVARSKVEIAWDPRVSLRIFVKLLSAIVRAEGIIPVPVPAFEPGVLLINPRLTDGIMCHRTNSVLTT